MGYQPFLNSSVGFDINDVPNPEKTCQHDRCSLDAMAKTYLYCLRYVDSLIIPFFLKSREKAYCSPINSEFMTTTREEHNATLEMFHIPECRHEDQLNDP